MNRVDAPAKVTGAAPYAGDVSVPGLLYGVVVSSAVAKGRITRIDTSRALAVPGVIRVYTHESRPELPDDDRCYGDDQAPDGSPFRPLFDARIRYSAQPIALAVADTFELARYAASLVEAEYEREPHATDLDAQLGEAFARSSKKKGDAHSAYARAALRHEAEYRHAFEHHHPMELHGTTAVWESGGRITVYTKTQDVMNDRDYVKNVFGFNEDDVRVMAEYVGGAFGSGLRPEYQLLLAVMAAKDLNRPVRVVLTRQQMFTFGHRPHNIQRLRLGADANGRLQAVMHDAFSTTSRYEQYSEGYLGWSSTLYDPPSLKHEYKLVPLDCATPMPMRAPGGATAVYAIEAAMDELACAAGIDPLELRLRNYTQQKDGKPFTSKALRECYAQAAERFGWSRRTPQPRSMQEGHDLIGWGMATGVWEAWRDAASARVVLTDDGRVEVSCSVTDIGPGSGTMMSAIAAAALGLPGAHIAVKLGDSRLPRAPVQGGSMTAASVGSAVHDACDKVRRRLYGLARDMADSGIAGAKLEDVVFKNGRIALARDAAQGIDLVDVMRRSGVATIDEEVESQPDKSVSRRYASYTHSAVFAEVRVDEDFGTVRVTRIVAAVAGGRIVSPKTARSQVLGGIVWGIGMALHEETFMDHTLGRFMNHNYAEYHVPVNADVRDIDVFFVDEREDKLDPIGAKGLGEIGVVGTAAAIANAVYHATGKRVRDLPITLEKLIG
ncbi:MAG TPA: xanthine dehydrogenase family protein molybdopterin-binding subunit [Burkholderiales bacterium]|nr:xanthine dehydrogenase family protein molybdopterin-binding subunit [Burkholderiales bacterium]